MVSHKVAAVCVEDLFNADVKREIIRAFKAAFPSGVFRFPQDMLDLPPSIRPHINRILSGFNLDCTDLHLNDCNFDGCNFSNISFAGCNFNQSSLQNCTLECTSFYKADLSYSTLHNSILKNTVLRLCNLEGIQAKNVTITWADFRNF